MTSRAVSRRAFLRAGAHAGAALVIGFHLPDVLDAVAEQAAFAPNAYLRISADNRITLWVTRSEMGQGVRTSLPMLLAEELEADWNAIRLEQAATVPAFREIRLRTSGSGSSSGTFLPLRRAGATAREMLITAASKRWGVERSSCRAESGAVVHVPTKRRLTYGTLAADAAKLPVPPENEVPLKDPKDFRIIGTARKRVDGDAIVRGSARYGLDVRVPGMRYAVVARCPYLGGKAIRWNDAKAKQVPGVLAVVPVTTGIATGVAVVAEHTWAAIRGREALEVEWDPGPHRNFNSDEFFARLRASLDGPGFRVRHEGDAPAALASAHRRIDATYEFPFQAHAPLEPMNCTAHVHDGRCEIWVPTQAPHTAQEEAAKLLGVGKEAVIVNVTLLGGGFGRRLFVDYVPEAVEVSRAIGAPVQVVWTREDDTRFGYFQPASVDRITCGLDAAGRPVAWLHKEAGSDLSVYPHEPPKPNQYADDNSPWGAFDNPYRFPTMKVDYVPVDSPVPTGPWRAVEYPPTVFARESFLDELAHATGKDPLALRLELLEPFDVLVLDEQRIDRGRLRRALEVVAEKSGWGKPLPQKDGRRWGRGMACNVYHAGSYVAHVAEVSVGAAGDVRVHRIVCAVDCGIVINPLALAGQAESGILWGLSAAIRGGITFRNGGAVESSYADFRVVQMDESPAIETHIIPSTARPGGFGEHPVPQVAPAVANAVFAATGKRIRRLPINNITQGLSA